MMGNSQVLLLSVKGCGRKSILQLAQLHNRLKCFYAFCNTPSIFISFNLDS